MPTNNKPNVTSPLFSPEQIAAALAAAQQTAQTDGIDWDRAIVTERGGVQSILESLRRKRGPNKHSSKERAA